MFVEQPRELTGPLPPSFDADSSNQLSKRGGVPVPTAAGKSLQIDLKNRAGFLEKAWPFKGWSLEPRAPSKLVDDDRLRRIKFAVSPQEFRQKVQGTL